MIIVINNGHQLVDDYDHSHQKWPSWAPISRVLATPGRDPGQGPSYSHQKWAQLGVQIWVLTPPKSISCLRSGGGPAGSRFVRKSTFQRKIDFPAENRPNPPKKYIMSQIPVPGQESGPQSGWEGSRPPQFGSQGSESPSQSSQSAIFPLRLMKNDPGWPFFRGGAPPPVWRSGEASFQMAALRAPKSVTLFTFWPFSALDEE